MALGDVGNNGKRQYDPTYYSRFRISNAESKLSLGFRFASGMLVASISKLKDENGFEYETLDEVWITPTKARILVDALDKVRNGESKAAGIGITAGLKETVSALVFHCQKDTCTGISIGKVDGDGKWVSRSSIDFNVDYHYAIDWSDIGTNKFDRQFNNTVEFDMVYDLIKSFAHNMAGAVAYSVADLARFDNSRAAGRLKPIYEKLGIEWGGGNNSRGDGNNFFNNSTRGGSADHKDFDDAMEELPFS